MKFKNNVMKIMVCLSLILGSISLDMPEKMVYAALSDGAYLVSRTTYYTNPETGTTEDGGSNTALGESMIESVLDSKVLVEKVNGKTYVTLGIGLMSSISSVNVEVQSKKGGSYQKVSLTKTGSCSKNGDTCNHYRFEVTSTDYYISPSLYVTPMGREVQFFIKLNMGSAVAGNGNFAAEMGDLISSDTVSGATEGAENSTESENNSSDNSSSASENTDKEQESSSNGSDSDKEESSESTNNSGSTTGSGSQSATESKPSAGSDSSTESVILESSSESTDSSNTSAEELSKEDTESLEESSEEISEEEATSEETEVNEQAQDVETRLEEAEGITIYSPQTEEESVAADDSVSRQFIPGWDIVAMIVTVVSCIGIGEFIGRKRMEKVNETK